MNGEINYFRIDSKNIFSIFTKEFIVKQTVNLYTTLSSGKEEQIGKGINKFFSKILPINSGDLFIINTSIASSKPQPTDFELDISINNILNSSYNNLQLKFEQSIIDDISRVLTFSINKINDYSSQYNIKTHADFLSALFEINYKNIDIVKDYKVNNAFLQSHPIIKSSGISSSFGSHQFGNGGGVYKQHNQFSAFSKNNYNQNIPLNSQKSFKYLKSEIEIFSLPNELIVLINKYQYIKRLVFSIEAVEEDKLSSFIIVLLNCQWLFPNIIEVEFDLTSQTMDAVLDYIFKQKLIEQMKVINKVLKTTTYDAYPIHFKNSKKWDANILYTAHSTYNTTTSSNSSSFLKDMSFLSAGEKRSSSSGEVDDILIKNGDNFIKENTTKLDMIIVYSYFISKWENMKVLMLRFPDSYSRELDASMREKGLTFVNISFLNFFVDITQLISLSIEFNALDMLNFEKILGMIHNNFNLRVLRLSLFSVDKDYSPSGLYKLCYGIKKPLKKIFDERKNYSKSFLNDDVDHLIIWKLLNDFQVNLEFLFFLLLKKNSITEFVLVLDLPSLLIEDEKYELVLIKFVLNFFMLISCEKHSYTIIKIIAPLLLFDPRKYPILQTIFEDLETDENSKKYLTDISTMTIQLKFFCFPKITNLITTRLITLFLGDLDVDTFIGFINFFTDASFIQKSHLMTLKLSLGYCIVNYRYLKEYFVKLYKAIPKDLGEHLLFSNLIMTYGDFLEILDLVNYNTCCKYLIEINYQCGEFVDKVIPVYYWTSRTNMDKLIVLKKKMILKFKEKNKKKNAISFKRIKNFLLDQKEIIAQTKESNEIN